MIGFSRDAIDLPIEKWESIAQHNACLQRLIARRKSEIAVEGPLVESKTAWKLAILQQSLLYRVCALGSGVTDAWNANNVSAAVILGRALTETVALTEFFRNELLRLRAPMDIAAADAIDGLCNQQLFSTKNEKIVADGFGYMARNILTYIDKFDKKMPSVRDAYDFMSEWVHPNGAGHLQTYGAINKETGCVTFKEAAPQVRGIQGHVVACFALIEFIELAMDAFDETIPMVGDVDKGHGPWVPGAIAGLQARRAVKGSAK